MKLRPYLACKDYESIKTWIADARTHAMWCANIFDYPLTEAGFESGLEAVGKKCGDSPYVVTNDDDTLIGFFCYSVNSETNEGMLKFVVNNPEFRGKGYGQKMIRTAVKYAFEFTGVDAVHLNVFPENERAKRCYESVGFVERNTDLNAFTYQNESWGRCNMIIRKGRVSGIHHVSMKTCSEEEYQRTVTFYKDVLGLAVARTWATGIMFDTNSGLLEIFTNGTEKFEKGVINHFALAVSDVDECVRRVTEAGYEIFVGPKDISIPSSPAFPARMAFCRGPLGEEIEFFKEI